MSQPKIAGRVPQREDLQAGKKYAWCACGESANQPWCDGSHKGGEFEPKVFTLEEAKTAGMCMCKQSKNAPFCDGMHKSLPAE